MAKREEEEWRGAEAESVSLGIQEDVSVTSLIALEALRNQRRARLKVNPAPVRGRLVCEIDVLGICRGVNVFRPTETAAG